MGNDRPKTNNVKTARAGRKSHGMRPGETQEDYEARMATAQQRSATAQQNRKDQAVNDIAAEDEYRQNNPVQRQDYPLSREQLQENFTRCVKTDISHFGWGADQDVLKTVVQYCYSLFDGTGIKPAGIQETVAVRIQHNFVLVCMYGNTLPNTLPGQSQNWYAQTFVQVVEQRKTAVRSRYQKPSAAKATPNRNKPARKSQTAFRHDQVNLARQSEYVQKPRLAEGSLAYRAAHLVLDYFAEAVTVPNQSREAAAQVKAREQLTAEELGRFKALSLGFEAAHKALTEAYAQLTTSTKPATPEASAPVEPAPEQEQVASAA